jgi:hypothetical protein
MNHTELSVKTTINDIESKLDKNANPYFKLTLRGFPNPFYAFSYHLSKETFKTLKEKPEQLTNQLALITYQETRSIRNTSVVGDQLPNQDNQGTFFKVKAIEIVP